MRVALATAAHLPHGSEDDQVLMAGLRSADLAPVSVIWDRGTEWGSFDVVVLRSIWDYHLKYPRFLAWLAELDAAGVAVHNPTDVVRWNADKRYMLDLERAGVRITPTRLATARDDVSLRQIADEAGWRQLVIKPTVASTGYETWLTDAPVNAEAESRFQAQRARMDVLVQQFVPGVARGEVSLVFLGGGYSHSVLKRAAGQEFRVHIEHGGTVEPVLPARAQIEWAETVVSAAPRPWSYARVDAVDDGDGPVLMELELLDPELFFKYDAGAAQRLITAITRGDHAR